MSAPEVRGAGLRAGGALELGVPRGVAVAHGAGPLDAAAAAPGPAGRSAARTGGRGAGAPVAALRPQRPEAPPSGLQCTVLQRE